MRLSDEQQALIDGLTYAGRLYERFLAEVDRMLARVSLGSPTERRVLIELQICPGLADSELMKALGLQKSQGSRTLAGLERQGLVEGRATPRHKLQRLRYLTSAGHKRASEILEQRSEAIFAQYDKLSPEERALLLEVSGLKDADVARYAAGANKLRPVVKTDWPWVFTQLASSHFADHPAKMAEYVNGIAGFALQDPGFKLGWIAEQAGQRVGVCLAALAEDNMRATIPYCFVVREARGLKVADELLARCIKSAKSHTLSSISAVTPEPSSMSKLLDRNGFKIEQLPKRFELTATTPRRFVLNLGARHRPA